jgi:hypothetical protein
MKRSKARSSEFELNGAIISHDSFDIKLGMLRRALFFAYSRTSVNLQGEVTKTASSLPRRWESRVVGSAHGHEKEGAKSAWIPTFVGMTSAAVERFYVVSLHS